MWLGIIRTVARRAVLGTVVASVAVAGLLAPAQAGAPTAPFDHAGDDVGEAIAAADQETCDGVPTHEIGAVQGSGDATPLAGRQVTVRGVVVGDVPGFSGFYLQDPDGDGDAATSDGIFVFSSVPVDLGDTVAVTGTSGSSAARRSSPRARTSTSATRAPPRTCPRPRRWTCRPTTPPASGSRACSSARSTASPSARSSTSRPSAN